MLLKIKKINPLKSTRLVWLHGWGQDHKSFVPLANMFEDCQNILVDMAGFGIAKQPDQPWGTADYANDLAEFLSNEKKAKKTYLIGHSFGCRVALRYTYQFPDKIDGLILIAAAGLKKKRSLAFKIKAFFLKSLAKLISKIDKIFKTNLKQQYANKFGSADYRSAKGIMRQVFVKTISEDLSEIATQIKTKTLLISGEKDQETPPEFGQRYQKLLPNSQFFELPNFDHYSILTTGKYQLQNLIANFIKNN